MFKETSVCIVDDVDHSGSEGGERTGKGGLKNPAYHFKRIGLEAGPYRNGFTVHSLERRLPVICVETRHMRRC